MGQVIIPSDKKIAGPWFLDRNCLEELNNSIDLIKNKFDDAFNYLVKNEAESNIEEYKKWHKDIDLEGAKATVKESYEFRKSDNFVLLTTKQGTKIREDNLLLLLKSNQISELSPTNLKIHIEKGPCELTIEITTKYDGEFESRLKIPDESYFNDVDYEISKWIDKHQPKKVLQKWSSWFPFAALPIFLFMIIITPMLIKDKSDIYKAQLQQESINLLKDGLTDGEELKALEIILQRQSGYIPETFNPDIKINNTIFNILNIIFIATMVLLIKPKTVIGLGKSKWKIGFYRKWTYIVLVYIPISIVIPFIMNKIN